MNKKVQHKAAEAALARAGAYAARSAATGEFKTAAVSKRALMSPEAGVRWTVADKDKAAPTARAADDLSPVHPGEILREEFLIPLGVKAPTAAHHMGVPRTRIERLAREETPVTADTALRLARFTGTTPEFWMSLQGRYDLETARRALGDDLNAVRRYGAEGEAANAGG